MNIKKYVIEFNGKVFASNSRKGELLTTASEIENYFWNSENNTPTDIIKEFELPEDLRFYVAKIIDYAVDKKLRESEYHKFININ